MADPSTLRATNDRGTPPWQGWLTGVNCASLTAVPSGGASAWWRPHDRRLERGFSGPWSLSPCIAFWRPSLHGTGSELRRTAGKRLGCDARPCSFARNSHRRCDSNPSRQRRRAECSIPLSGAVLPRLRLTAAGVQHEAAATAATEGDWPNPPVAQPEHLEDGWDKRLRSGLPDLVRAGTGLRFAALGAPQPKRVSVQINMSESENHDGQASSRRLLIAITGVTTFILAGWLMFLAFMAYRLVLWICS
jgi:hypothetical protein